jgi:hypothetical protein
MVSIAYRGTMTVRASRVFGAPKTSRPPTSVAASSTRTLRLAGFTRPTRSAFASPNRQPDHPSNHTRPP